MHMNNYTKEELEKISVHINDRELSASRAERDSVKYKQVEYLQNHINETFKGVITGVKSWGVYVEIIENKCEGLLRSDQMGDFSIIEDHYCIENLEKDITYHLGDTITIEVIGVDLFKKEIDFKLVD